MSVKRFGEIQTEVVLRASVRVRVRAKKKQSESDRSRSHTHSVFVVTNIEPAYIELETIQSINNR
jgi:hypothetical protein